LFISNIPAAYGYPNQGQGDQAFIIIMTALVQIMTPGLALFYGGLVGEGSVIYTMMLSFGTMAVVTILWFLIGYSLAFGPIAVPGSSMNLPVNFQETKYSFSDWNVQNAAPEATSSTIFIGNGQLALVNFGDLLRQGGWTGPKEANYWYTEGAVPTYLNITETAFMLFQLMFAIVTAALISGAIVGKMRFIWFMLFVALWNLLVYCPLAHWIFFFNGWLYTYGAIDYAGGLVVHVASGMTGWM
jgi:Amt family ammonium transporter